MKQTNNSILDLYIPWAKEAESIVEKLTRMGIKKDDIETVFRGNTGHLYGKITNPDSGKDYLVTFATVQLISKGKEWNLTVNNKPYHQFFEDLDKDEAILARAADENKLIAQLLDENKELKRMLSLVGKG